jgi:hypothetical protein
MCKRLPLVALVLLLSGVASEAGELPRRIERRIDIHLYGGDTTAGAPLAPWYHSIGITDVWLAYPKGAFPQDAGPELQGLHSVGELQTARILDHYRRNGIRYWWFERPVPDYFYVRSRSPDFPKSHLWDSSAPTDMAWERVCGKIKSIYPQARKAGFAGFVYDTEAYYSYRKDAPWLWGGSEDQYGINGNYYRRGLQVGKAIHTAWPKAKLIIAYCHGYAGERWWYQGLMEGGVDLCLGPEHTYGAGPGNDGLGNQWYQSWWGGRKTKETCDWKRTQFPFVADNRHVSAGLFPIDFGAGKPNYRAEYFRQQLASAANDDPRGPISVWIWPQGPFTPESWRSVKYAAGDTAETYLRAIGEFSSAFANR